MNQRGGGPIGAGYPLRDALREYDDAGRPLSKEGLGSCFGVVSPPGMDKEGDCEW